MTTLPHAQNQKEYELKKKSNNVESFGLFSPVAQCNSHDPPHHEACSLIWYIHTYNHSVYYGTNKRGFLDADSDARFFSCTLDAKNHRSFLVLFLVLFYSFFMFIHHTWIYACDGMREVFA